MDVNTITWATLPSESSVPVIEHWTLTSASFVYSGACTFLSPILILLCQAFFTSIKLYRRTRSKYYHGFTVIATLRCFEQMYAILLSLPETISNDTIWLMNAVNYFLVGFLVTGLNAWRFVKTTRKWNIRLTQVALALIVVSFVCYVAVYAWYFYCIFTQSDRTEANRAFLLWAIYDSLVNAFISASFLMYLRHLGVRAAVSMRSGMRHLIVHTQITISVECVLLFGVCVYQYISPHFDPYWATTSLVEALRLRFLTNFFDVLHKVMHQRNDTASGMQLKILRQALSKSPSTQRTITASISSN